jgi:hypothetical protein
VTKDTTPVCPIDKHDFANCDVFKMTNPVKSITIISENESESVSGKYMNEVVPYKSYRGVAPVGVNILCWAMNPEHQTPSGFRVSTKHENQVVVATRAVVRYCLRSAATKSQH